LPDQPTSQVDAPPTHGVLTRRQRVAAAAVEPDDASRKTYRYLRLGMIGAMVLLGASVLVERANAPGCWQTSISAYYYTPVRAVFVGALMAIGLSLIVIQGSTVQEDLCLNAAGMLAPVVALVPTSGVGSCWSIQPEPPPTRETPSGPVLQDWVVANIDNNILALLVAFLFGLVAAAVVAAVAVGVNARRTSVGASEVLLARLRAARRRANWVTTVLLVLTAVVLLLGALLFLLWDDFDTNFHSYAAGAMFGFLILAAVFNGLDTRDRGGWYPRLYFAIAALMAATALLLLVDGWTHRVLWIEVLEITWFLMLWVVQSRELWDSTLRHGTDAGAEVDLRAG
jgi:hypothetical protein